MPAGPGVERIGMARGAEAVADCTGTTRVCSSSKVATGESKVPRSLSLAGEAAACPFEKFGYGSLARDGRTTFGSSEEFPPVPLASPSILLAAKASSMESSSQSSSASSTSASRSATARQLGQRKLGHVWPFRIGRMHL